MRPGTLWYLLKSGFVNIRRNLMFSLASIMTMAACIFLFGVFYAIVNNVSYLTRTIEKEVPVTVFFQEGTTEDEMREVGNLIAARPEVSSIEFESAQDAWEKMKKTYFGDSDAAEGFKDDNPLINSSNYRVYLNDIEYTKVLVRYIEGLEHVREVNESEQAASTLGNFNRAMSYVSMVLIAILMLIAIFLISNTISVGITVRSEEIGIMKYIGATDFFVRAPFVLEGILLGLAGAVIPMAALYFVYSETVSYILAHFSVLEGTVNFIPIEKLYQTLLPISLGLGVGVGLLGSFFTTRKHLRV